MKPEVIKMLREKYGLGEPPPPYEPIPLGLVEDVFRRAMRTANWCSLTGAVLAGIVAIICWQVQIHPAVTFLLTYMAVIIGGSSMLCLLSRHEKRNRLKSKSSR